MASISAGAKSIRSSFGLYDTVTEEFSSFTNTYDSDVLRDCSKYEVLITWLNSLGAWEYWLFQGNTTYGYDIEDSQEADKSSFENWDSNFTQAETERFFASVDARIERTIRANELTQSQAQALGTVGFSIHAQEFLSDGSKQTVQFGKSSQKIRTEQEKLINLDFEIINTQRLPIQNG